MSARVATLDVSSSAFAPDGMVPRQYTGDGKDVSPPLAWKGMPPEARSLALVCEDPDAPAGTWIHWVIYNMPPGTTGLSEHVPASPTLPSGARQGLNDFKKIGYNGPQPPSGTHRYIFRVSAVDCMLSLPPGATAEQLAQALRGHVLAEGQLVGRYHR